MKKASILILILCLFSFCTPKSQNVETIMEDGVEVVLNHLEPYSINNEPSGFSLEEEFFIDFEDVKTAEIGIGEVRGFDVDSKGNIYILCDTNVFQFDGQGNFLRKLGNKGEGPGEFGHTYHWMVTDFDEFAINDYINGKWLIFSENGEFREIKIPTKAARSGFITKIFPQNSGYLYDNSTFDEDSAEFDLKLTLLDSEFEEIKDLEEKVRRESPFKSARINLFTTDNLYTVVGNKIYACTQDNREYQINVYNMQGEILKRIRKEYNPVKLSKEYKNRRMENHKNSPMWRIHKMEGYFPDDYPPIKNLYVDSDEKILVGTYEEGEMPETEKIDIFNPEGIFTGAAYLDKAVFRVFKNGRLYATHEKESGYHKLTVSRVVWED